MDSHDLIDANLEDSLQRHPCESSPCLFGGTCVAAAAAFAGGRDFVCRCPPGTAGDICQEQGEPSVHNSRRDFSG